MSGAKAAVSNEDGASQSVSKPHTYS